MTSPQAHFRTAIFGTETLGCSFRLPRHRHFRAYATIVLRGTFEESGYAGRINAAEGDVLIHPTMDCHRNRVVSAGHKVIRLDWLEDGNGPAGFYRVDNLDELERTAAKDMTGAVQLLQHTLRTKALPSPNQKNDWPDLLLSDLASTISTKIGVWAERNGLARETISRGFKLAYGVTPSVLRGELRARAAWLQIVKGSDCLSGIAAHGGFADQAHMTRWIRRTTGAPPSEWRKLIRDGISLIDSPKAQILRRASSPLFVGRPTIG